MNRIQDATFKEGTGNITSLAWATAAGNAFSEYGYTYDLNGNIKTLKRKGAGGSDMDILQYSYGGGFDQGNKLNYVTDSGIDTTGFRELNAPGYDYSYDTNGNLRWDKNKGGKDLLTNADFQAGASGWTVYDPGSRLSFPGPSLLASPGTDSATVTQQDIIQPNSRVLVFIELEHLSGSGSVNVNIGGTDLSVSVAGLNTIPVYAGGGTSVTITPSADFDGYIHNVQVKGYAVFEYNFLNLPERVTMGGDQYLMYYYDATGRKLTQELYKSDKTLLKRSDYIGEYFYENDTLRFINHEEGRVVMTGNAPEYQYHLKDHLGNVRLTFTTKDDTDSTTATLEIENIQAEQSEFLRYENARRIQATLFDRTNGSSTGYSQRLNGTPNEKYGLAKSISVMPGDVINTEVYAKYVDTESSNWTQALVDVMGAIAANTGGVVVDGGSYAASTSSFSYGGFVNTSGSSGTAPKAFLNWIVFDKNFNMLDGGFEQITTAAKETGTDIPHQRLFKDNINITKPGYVYIYLSNENETPVEVFFDDFTVEHTKSPVVQMDDYYPFGLTFNSYTRENSVPNKIKFQGQEHVDDLGLNWDSFKWRNHQPDIGRFFNIDPLAEKYYYNSPYAFSENDVVSAVELEGLEKLRITNYSKIQSEKISENLEAKNNVLNTPVSEESRVSQKVDKIDQSNNEVMRIVTYGTENGFKDNFMTNKLEGNGIEVPDVVKNGEQTTTVEVIDAKAKPSAELYGVTENKDGGLSINKLGDVNPSKEMRDVGIGTVKAIGLKAIEFAIELFISKKSPVEIPPIVTEKEKKDLN